MMCHLAYPPAFRPFRSGRRVPSQKWRRRGSGRRSGSHRYWRAKHAKQRGMVRAHCGVGGRRWYVAPRPWPRHKARSCAPSVSGIRLHSGSGGSIRSRVDWTPRTTADTYNGPHIYGLNDHLAGRVGTEPSSNPAGFHIYAPNTIGDYNLRLRSQLMLPPANTGFLLVPCHPNDRGRPIALFTFS